MYRNTYAKIDTSALKRNVQKIANYYKGYDYYFGVVKANAYGHSDLICADLIKEGINYFAVSSLEEALSIRKNLKNIPILCLEPIDLKHINIAIENNITLTIHDYDYFKKLLSLKFKDRFKVHLKIDSGMNRLGLKDKNEVTDIYNTLIIHKLIELEGIYTHLATSGISDKYWDIQIDKFKNITSEIDYKKIPIIHVGRSLTLIAHKKLDFCNGVRVGIMMYGYNNLPTLNNSIKSYIRKFLSNLKKKRLNISQTLTESPIKLETALTLHSEIMQVKKVKKGEFVGYGASFVADEDITIGIIPIGYADGISKKMTGMDVLIKGKRFKIIGEINMDMIAVLIDESINNNDEVILIGGEITLKEIANYTGRTVYETLTSISSRVPRILK